MSFFLNFSMMDEGDVNISEVASVGGDAVDALVSSPKRKYLVLP